MYDKLFGEWRGEFAGVYTKANLKKFGADIGLDATSFNKCVDNEETKSVIDADIAEVNRLGIQGTPTFMIGGRQLNVRTLDYSEFSRTFDALLK